MLGFAIYFFFIKYLALANIPKIIDSLPPVVKKPKDSFKPYKLHIIEINSASICCNPGCSGKNSGL